MKRLKSTYKTVLLAVLCSFNNLIKINFVMVVYNNRKLSCLGVPLSPYGSSQTMTSLPNKPSGSTLLAGFLSNKNSLTAVEQKENSSLNNNNTNFSKMENKEQRGASLERENSSNTDPDTNDKERMNVSYRFFFYNFTFLIVY